MSPLLLILLGGAGYALYEKWTHPSWSPITSLLATPSELSAALAHLRTTSVPTPSKTSGLDPNMTTDHVSEANTVLMVETSVKKLRDFARAAAKLGFGNTANAVIAKANAVDTAKSAGASDADVTQATSPATATGFDLFAHGNAPGSDARPGWGTPAPAMRTRPPSKGVRSRRVAHHAHPQQTFAPTAPGGGAYGDGGGWHPHHHHHHHGFNPSMGGMGGFGGMDGGGMGGFDPSAGLDDNDDSNLGDDDLGGGF